MLQIQVSWHVWHHQFVFVVQQYLLMDIFCLVNIYRGVFGKKAKAVSMVVEMGGEVLVLVLF